MIDLIANAHVARLANEAYSAELKALRSSNPALFSALNLWADLLNDVDPELAAAVDAAARRTVGEL